MKMFSIKLKTTTAIYCPYCHSPLVEHGKPIVHEDLIAHKEIYGIWCRKCGAKGHIVESWSHSNEATQTGEDEN